MKLSKRFFIISLIGVLLLLIIGQVLAATSPTLGYAESFVVLGHTAIVNVPNSVIFGDVGLSPAASNFYTGLTTPEVTGFIYTVNASGNPGWVENKTLVDNAQLANTAAYLALSAGDNAACTADYGGVTEDLSGKTLVPGVYCARDFLLTNANGPLTLDNSIDPRGVWIFRSESTLITSSGVGATVRFADVNVNSSCNVWWQVGSSATIGVGSSFIGNILALASIELMTNAHLEGRAFAQTGAVRMDRITITYPTCVFPQSPTARPRRTAVPDDEEGSGLPAFPGTGSGAVIFNEMSPWSFLLFGGVFTFALMLGVRSLRKSDHLKK